MPALADLTHSQRHILRTACGCDAAIFDGERRRPIERLHALGLITRRVEFIPGPTPNGHHEPSPA